MARLFKQLRLQQQRVWLPERFKQLYCPLQSGVKISSLSFELDSCQLQGWSQAKVGDAFIQAADRFNELCPWTPEVAPAPRTIPGWAG